MCVVMFFQVWHILDGTKWKTTIKWTQVCHKINSLKFLLFCVKICTLILTFIENPVSSYTIRRKACPRPQLLADTSSLRWQFACQLFAQVGLMQVLLLHCFCTLLALAHFLLTTIRLTLYNIERGQAHFMCAPLKKSLHEVSPILDCGSWF